MARFRIINWRNHPIGATDDEQAALVLAAGHSRSTGELSKVIDTNSQAGDFCEVSLHNGRVDYRWRDTLDCV